MKLKKIKEHVYFDSKINREQKESFEIIESLIGFDHVDFRQRVKEEIKYIGMNYDELARNCYVDRERIIYVLTMKADFANEEIKRITKLLGM